MVGCVQKALLLLETASSKYQHEFPGLQAEVLTGSLKECVPKAKKCVQAALVTQVEVLVCRSFGKSSKPLSRVTAYLAEYTQMLKTDVKALMAPALAAFVEAKSSNV